MFFFSAIRNLILTSLTVFFFATNAQASLFCTELFVKDPKFVRLAEDFYDLIHQKKNEEALTLVEKALSEGSISDNLLHLKTRALMILRRHDEALKVAQLRSQRYPNSSALGSLAKILSDLGRFDEALEALEQKLKMNPNDGLNRKARILLNLQRYDEAIATADRKLQLQQNDLNALDLKLQALMRTHRYKDVLFTANQILSLMPNDFSALVKKSTALMALEKYEEIIPVVDQILIQSPNDAVAIGRKTKALILLQRYEEALDAIKSNLAIHPHDIKALTMKASVFLNLNQYKEALLQIEHVLNLKPNDPIATRVYMNILFKLRKHNAVIPLAKKYIEQYPQDKFVLLTLTRSYMETRRWNEALDIVDGFLLKQSSKAIVPLNLKARLLIQLGRTNEALSVLQKLPEEFARDFYTAVALIDLKQYQKAIDILQTLDAKPSVLWRMAQAYFSMGRMDLAYKKLIELVQKEKRPNLGALSAMIKIESMSGSTQLSPLLEILLKNFKAAHLLKISEIQEQIPWDVETPPLAEESSIYNPFYSTLYTQPVDSQTRRSTK